MKLIAITSLLAAALAGCAADDAGERTIDVRIGALSTTCKVPSLAAKLTIGKTLCPLERDTNSGAFAGSCKTDEVGADLDAVLEYTATPSGKVVTVARATTKVTIPQQGQVTISFKPTDLTYPDDDGDGIKTVDELCIGIDPTKKDAPTFAQVDPVVHEKDAIGSAQGLYVVGERIRVLGSNFPEVKYFEVTIGPGLDGKPVDVPIRALTATTLDLQIPAGINARQPQTLTVEVLGQTWQQQLSVGRAVVVSGDSRVVITSLHRGDIAAAPVVQKTTCVPDSISNCATNITDKCSALLHSISPDGRLVVGQCATQAHDELFVIDIPVGKRWPISSSLSLASATAFVLGGRFVAQLDIQSGELALRKVDSEARTLGPPIGQVTIAKGRGMRASLDGAFVYVFSGADRASDKITRVALTEDASQGTAAFDMGSAKEIDLGDGCAPLPRKCEDDWSKSMHEASAGELLFARPGLSRVELIDFNATPAVVAQVTQPIFSAHAVAVSPAGDRLYTHGRNGGGDSAANGVCSVALAAFNATPSCHYLTPAGITTVGFAIAASPDSGGAVAASFVLPTISLITGYRVLQGNNFKTVDAGQKRPFGLLVQP